MKDISGRGFVQQGKIIISAQLSQLTENSDRKKSSDMKVFIEWGHCALDKASIKIEIDKQIQSLIQCCHLQHMRKSAAKNSKL